MLRQRFYSQVCQAVLTMSCGNVRTCISSDFLHFWFSNVNNYHLTLCVIRGLQGIITWSCSPLVFLYICLLEESWHRWDGNCLEIKSLVLCWTNGADVAAQACWKREALFMAVCFNPCVSFHAYGGHLWSN